jgi:hypothetical protein
VHLYQKDERVVPWNLHSSKLVYSPLPRSFTRFCRLVQNWVLAGLTAVPNTHRPLLYHAVLSQITPRIFSYRRGVSYWIEIFNLETACSPTDCIHCRCLLSCRNDVVICILGRTVWLSWISFEVLKPTTCDKRKTCQQINMLAVW